MDYRTMLRFQKWLHLNVYLSGIWFIVVAFFLYNKVELLGHLTKYLSLTVFTLLILIESTRLYLGHYGNLACRVPELAGFLMLTVLMQMPLVSFFVFNPYLLSTPTELTLHAMLWLFSIMEIVLGYLALRNASYYAKTVYFSHSKESFKMPQLTTFMKAEIVVLHEQNIPIKEIARRLHIARNTVRLWIRRYGKSGDMNRNRPGPVPIMYTDQSRRHREIIARHVGAPFTTTRSTAQIYNITMETVLQD